jgi:hypothetical protein
MPTVEMNGVEDNDNGELSPTNQKQSQSTGNAFVLQHQHAVALAEKLSEENTNAMPLDTITQEDTNEVNVQVDTAINGSTVNGEVLNNDEGGAAKDNMTDSKSDIADDRFEATSSLRDGNEISSGGLQQSTNTTDETQTRSLRRKRETEQASYAPDSTTKTKRGKKDSNVESEFESVWICCECREAECMMKPDADRLLICEGPCRRLSHYPCAGLTRLPAEDEPYICNDCRNENHACAFCHQYGDDNTDVFQCVRPSCGLFYHEACLQMHNVEVKYQKDVKVSEVESDEVPSLRPIFTCPAHWCWTCTQTDLLTEEKEEEAEEKSQSKQKKGKKKKKKSAGVFITKPESRRIVSSNGYSYNSAPSQSTRLTICSSIEMFRMSICLSHYMHST